MLKRYLRSRYNLSPEEYRRRWGLPAEYPMVAPAYAERRYRLRTGSFPPTREVITLNDESRRDHVISVH